jgi:hypothetical protein
MNHVKLKVRENAVLNLIGSSGVEIILGTAVIRLVFQATTWPRSHFNED